MSNRPTVPPDPKPARVLREQLAECRARGLDFDQAWTEATAVALRVRGAGGKFGWEPTFEWSRPTWRRAYERQEPRRGERLRVGPTDLTPAA